METALIAVVLNLSNIHQRTLIVGHTQQHDRIDNISTEYLLVHLKTCLWLLGLKIPKFECLVKWEWHQHVYLVDIEHIDNPCVMLSYVLTLPWQNIPRHNLPLYITTKQYLPILTSRVWYDWKIMLEAFLKLQALLKSLNVKLIDPDEWIPWRSWKDLLLIIRESTYICNWVSWIVRTIR